MKVIGIIAEYNPFHNGHKYQIEEARRRSGADYVVAVMSPDFVQRGTPALCDRYVRTKAALSNGIDLCLSMPVLASCASAEYFAEAGIRILDRIGVVDQLSFGCEYPVPAFFSDVIDILNREPAGYREVLTNLQKKGLSYPAARQQALLFEITQRAKSAGHPTDPEMLSAVGAWFENPNCLLGIEYLRALSRIGSPILPLPVIRKGKSYHDPLIFSPNADNYPSALGLRTYIQAHGIDETLRACMPDPAYDLLKSCRLYTGTQDPYDLILHYRLMTCDHYEDYLDVSEELARRIRKLLPEYTTAEAFAQSLKTRQITLTRARRALLHIFLGITGDQARQFHHSDALYAHILGFRKEASPLLRAIREKSTIPLIGRASDASKLLSPQACDLFSIDLRAASLYRLLLQDPGSHKKTESEYARSPIIV